jgi:ferredoxin
MSSMPAWTLLRECSGRGNCKKNEITIFVLKDSIEVENTTERLFSAEVSRTDEVNIGDIVEEEVVQRG